MTMYGAPRLELPRVEHSNDVIAPDLDRRLRLADESRDGIGLHRHVRREELHRDPLVELQVHRRDDDPHPADAEHALDAVLPGEQLAGLRDARGHARPLGDVGLRVGAGTRGGVGARRGAERRWIGRSAHGAGAASRKGGEVAQTPPARTSRTLGRVRGEKNAGRGTFVRAVAAGAAFGDRAQESVTGAPTQRKRLESRRRACDSLVAMLLMPGDDRVST